MIYFSYATTLRSILFWYYSWFLSMIETVVANFSAKKKQQLFQIWYKHQVLRLHTLNTSSENLPVLNLYSYGFLKIVLKQQIM